MRLLILHLNWHVPCWQTAGKPSTLFDLVGLHVAPVLRVLVEQNERTTDCRLKAFPMRTLYMVIWQLFDAARAAAAAAE